MDGMTDTFGAVATILFATSHVPMVVKAVRTRDVHSYSLPNLVLVNVGNALWTVYVVALPIGPIWALHALYVLAGATMLAMVLRSRCSRWTAGSAAPTGRPGASSHAGTRDALE